MMKNIKSKAPLFLVLAIGLIVLANLPAQAKTILVDKNLTGCQTGDIGPFATINGGLSAAASGDTMYVCPATYPEQITVNIPNLTMLGVSTAETSLIEITPPAAGLVNNGTASNGFPVAPVVRINANNVNFGNFTVNGANNQVANCPDTSPTGPILSGIFLLNNTGSFVFNNTVINTKYVAGPLSGCNDGFAIYVNSTNATAKTTNVLNNEIRNFQKDAIHADGTAITAIIRGNFIIGDANNTVLAQNGMQISRGATGDIFNNRLTSIRFGQCTGIGFCPANSVAILLLFPGANATVRYNKVQTSQTGIAAVNMNNASLNNNEISNSIAGDGIFIQDSNFNTITLNTIFGSEDAGIFIFSSGAPSESTGNSVTQNFIQDAPVGVFNGGVSTTISNNTYLSVADNVNP